MPALLAPQRWYVAGDTVAVAGPNGTVSLIFDGDEGGSWQFTLLYGHKRYGIEWDFRARIVLWTGGPIPVAADWLEEWVSGLCREMSVGIPASEMSSTERRILDEISRSARTGSYLTGRKLRASLGINKELFQTAASGLVPRYVELRGQDNYSATLLGMLNSCIENEARQALRAILKCLRSEFCSDPDAQSFTLQAVMDAGSLDQDARWLAYNIIQVAHIHNGGGGSGDVGHPGSNYRWDMPPDIEELAAFRSEDGFLRYLRSHPNFGPWYTTPLRHSVTTAPQPQTTLPTGKYLLTTTEESIIAWLPRGLVLIEEIAYQDSESWSVKLHYYSYQDGWQHGTHYHPSYADFWNGRYDVQMRKLQIPIGDWDDANGIITLAMDLRSRSRTTSIRKVMHDDDDSFWLVPPQRDVFGRTLTRVNEMQGRVRDRCAELRRIVGRLPSADLLSIESVLQDVLVLGNELEGKHPLVQALVSAASSTLSSLSNPVASKLQFDRMIVMLNKLAVAEYLGDGPEFPSEHLDSGATRARGEVISASADKSYVHDQLRDPEVPGASECEKSHEEVEASRGWLALATEWTSRHGGISTFNRQLCTALAAAGERVVCLVPFAPTDDVAAAKSVGVELISAPNELGTNDPDQLLRRKPVLPQGFSPTLIVGHGRITGRAAQSLSEDHYPNARRLHIVHMAPEEIEWYKFDRKDDPAVRAEERRKVEVELGKTAHKMIAVGPRLARRYQRDVGRGSVKVVRLNPGIRIRSSSVAPPGGSPHIILTFGRMEDPGLKRPDLAARAAGLAWSRNPNLELVVRGAPEGTAAEARAQLIKEAGVNLPIIIRSYTADEERLADDLESASVVLMPSRVEGFGLVGWEAIEAGVPVRVSSESGLGELLKEVLPDETYRRYVIPVTGEDERDAQSWAIAIETALHNREAEFGAAADLRHALAERFNWDDVVRRLLEDIET